MPISELFTNSFNILIINYIQLSYWYLFCTPNKRVLTYFGAINLLLTNLVNVGKEGASLIPWDKLL